MSKEKQICIGCSERKNCVELIYSEICPQGLHNCSLEEARNIQDVWNGKKKVCKCCKGSGYVTKKTK